MEFLEKLFANDFMPHGHCYLWKSEIVWTNAISDSIIALAYLTIPISLVHIVRTRKDFKFYWLLVLFALFILGCGGTHVMDVINIWKPVYRLDSTIRVITAIASVGTAIMLIKITPQLLIIPNPEDYKKINEELKSLNLQLEEKVQERTIQLKKHEEILSQRENQLRIITNAIPAFISYIDKDLVYRFTNDYYKRLPNSNGELTNIPMKSLVSEEVFLKSQPFLSKAFDGEFVTFETEVILNDNSRKHINVNYIPDKDDKEEIRGIVVMGVDMTERISYEKSLEEKNKQLTRTNTDLDNFIYTASHDLKAPISNMEGLLDSIYEDLEKNQNEEVHELLNMMKVSINRLTSTITELTEISLIQKELNQPSEQISIAAVIEEFKIDYKKQIKDNNAVIQLELEVDSIMFIRKNFRSILYNLLSNALKYRRSEINPEIQIKTKRIEKDCIMLSISDNGLGLNENQRMKIFGMYKRMHDHVDGSGIGLYIVKRIIENVDGKIEIESEPHRGSTFKVFIKQ